jgi:predicted DNA-binding transcriptional regulator AlpA
MAEPATKSSAARIAQARTNISDRLCYRLADIAMLTGISRRSIERERAAGRFPRPDRVVGRCPLWRVETIQQWLAGD